MAKMAMAENERVEVKLKCAQMLGNLQLEHLKETIISEFIDTYLKLSEEEELQFETALQKLAKPEQEAVMPIRMSWRERGKAEGKAEGVLSIVLLQLNEKLGPLDSELINQLQALSIEKLQELAKAIFQINSIDALSSWLAARQSETRHSNGGKSRSQETS
jgi:hypothetical protein